MPDEIGWMWASPKPGVTVRPRSATTRVAGPASLITSRSPPSATIRPPRTATACAQLDGASAANTRPPARMRSAESDELVERMVPRMHEAGHRARRVSPCGLTATLRP